MSGKSEYMCNKVKFTKAEAQGALKNAFHNRNKYRKECRIYECPDCKGFWHVTSKEEYDGNGWQDIENLKFKKKWKKLMI